MHPGIWGSVPGGAVFGAGVSTALHARRYPGPTGTHSWAASFPVRGCVAWLLGRLWCSLPLFCHLGPRKRVSAL